jgi:tetratricopeptide (TPR) repeat protein
MMAVGLGRQALELQKKLDSPDALDRLTRQAADQAVLRPDRASAAPPEIRDGAARVRSVLESLTKATADAATAALDGLRDVSRNSPFADWRLFARGLVAFRRRDDVEARANWDRLDPDRAASRIARGLSAATDSTLRDGKPSPKVEALERRAFGEPILGPLRELGDLAAQGLWPEAIRRLAAVRLALRRLDPRLAVRLTEALYPLVLNEATGLGYQAGQNLLKAFTKAAEPLPVDARWNRLWALAWESPQGHPEEARPFWKRYLDDLDASPAIRADERPIAKAIVLAHEGREWLNLALDLEDEEPRRVVDEEATDARRTAVSLLQESLKLFPSRRETYRTLMEVYETSDQPEKAAEVAGRVLEALPEDFEALDFLGQHHYRRGEPDRALEYAIRARKLKPLDRDVLMNEVGSRVALSRRLALEGRYDEARAELAITAELNPESVGRPLSAARRACLEIKAGATEAAKAIIDEALGQLPEPAPLWLAMAIEARRIKLPQAEIDHREGLWRKAVAGKVRGETAGELAGIAVPFQAKGISYPGCEEHTEQVMDYIRRTAIPTWSRSWRGRASNSSPRLPNSR